VGFVCQPGVEVDLVLRAEREAAGVKIAIDVVGVNAVEAFGLAQVEARAQEGRQQVNLADVQPPLAGPARVVIAERRGGILRGVGPPLLPGAGVQVTHQFWLIGNLRDQNLLNTDYTDGHGKSTDFFGVFREIPCNP